MANQTQPSNVKQLFDLHGKVAVITGGSIGLGRQMAEGLAEMGADVVLCARKKERCEEAAHDLARLGVKTAALGCDVKDPANIQKMVDDSVNQFGRIDILINNAGISWGALVEKMTLEEWNKVIETNLTGTVSVFAGRRQSDDQAGRRQNYQRCIGRRTSWRAAGHRERHCLSCQQRRRDFIHQGSRLEVGAAQHTGERAGPGMVPNSYVRQSAGAQAGAFVVTHSASPLWF